MPGASDVLGAVGDAEAMDGHRLVRTQPLILAGQPDLDPNRLPRDWPVLAGWVHLRSESFLEQYALRTSPHAERALVAHEPQL